MLCALVALWHYYFHLDSWISAAGSLLRARALLISTVLSTFGLAIAAWTLLAPADEIEPATTLFDPIRPLETFDGESVLEIRRTAYAERLQGGTTITDAIYAALMPMESRWPTMIVAEASNAASGWHLVDAAMRTSGGLPQVLIRPDDMQAVTLGSLAGLFEMTFSAQAPFTLGLAHHEGTETRAASTASILLSREDWIPSAKGQPASPFELATWFREALAEAATHSATGSCSGSSQSHFVPTLSRWKEALESRSEPGQLPCQSNWNALTPAPLPLADQQRLRDFPVLGHLHRPRPTVLHEGDGTGFSHERAVKSLRLSILTSLRTLPENLHPNRLFIDSGENGDVALAIREAATSLGEVGAAPFFVDSLIDLRERHNGLARTGSIGALVAVSKFVEEQGESAAAISVDDSGVAEFFLVTPSFGPAAPANHPATAENEGTAHV